MAVTLAIENLAKSYQIPILRSIELTIDAGGLVCVLGPNGCGKTTLLRIVGGMEPPTAGRVLIGGTALAPGLPHTHRIGVVFQEDRLLPWLTLADNVALVLKPLQASTQVRRAIARRYLEFVGLRGFERYYPNKVSGSMRQRAAIARALAIEPEILLMDEPFGALDAQNRRIMQREVKRIWEETGKTVLFVTHSIEEAVLLGTTLVMLSARPATVRAVIDNDGHEDAAKWSDRLHAMITEEVYRQQALDDGVQPTASVATVVKRHVRGRARMRYTGQPVKRLEDPRLLTGRGTFVDDLRLPDMLYAAVLRSPHAHAAIAAIKTLRARRRPGVVAVLTAKDLAGAVRDIPPRTTPELEGVRVPEHPVLARDKVCYVGQPVAVVVARERYLASDVLELIEVDYRPLPALIDPLEAAREDAPPIHPEFGSNVAMRVRVGRGDLPAAFAQADVVVRGRYDVPRLSPAPLEGRGLVASYQAAADLLTLWTSTQVPHKVKTYLGRLLARPPRHLRVVAPDVGGGFGQKVEVWPEDLALSYLAMALGRPIKWVEERRENLLAYHGRGHAAEAEAAVRRDGTILGMRFRIVADLGAYFLTSTPGPPINAAQRVAGPYAIPTMAVECLGVLTNKPPTGPYRGAGGPEGAFFMERTIDLIARELGLDPVEVRRRNFIPPEAFPYTTATGLTYDSGAFQPALERALELAEYADVRQRQRARGPQEPLLGVGVATVVKASGGRGEMRHSLARTRVEPNGRVQVYTEVSPHGQGTATTFAQIAADALGVRLEDVQILHGDTDMLPAGQGTFASRGLTIGGSAMYLGLQELRRHLARLAARFLECPPEEIVFADGKVFDRRYPEQALPFSQVALAAHRPESLPPGVTVGAESLTPFTLPDNAFSFGAHVVVVEVERDTGAVRILRYAAVHDCGRVINPLLAAGQVHGAIAQGLMPALAEAMIYSPAGQPLSGTLLDYAVPVAADLPDIRLDLRETPSPTNPLGVKGIGELPTVAAPVAVANAVLDALSSLGIRHLDIPLTPEKLWRAMQRAGDPTAPA
jgi:carbon-monoxide dehydrogenase large subunit